MVRVSKKSKFQVGEGSASDFQHTLGFYYSKYGVQISISIIILLLIKNTEFQPPSRLIK